MKTGFQSQPAKQPLKPVFTLENGYARDADDFLQDDTFIYIFFWIFISAQVSRINREEQLISFCSS